MKKSISLIVLVVFITAISTVFAVEGLKFSISESQALARSNSKQSTIDDLNIKTKESALEEAQKDAKKSTGVSNRVDKLNNGIAKEVTTVKAEADLVYASRTKKKNVKLLELDAYKVTANMLLIKEELAAETAKQAILDEKYKMTEIRLREGKVTQNDLNDAKYALDLKKIDVNKITKKLETANLELKRVLRLDMTSDMIEIRDKLTSMSTEKVDVERIIVNAINNDLELYMKAAELTASEKTMELTKIDYEPGATVYDENMLKLESAKLAYDEAKVSLEVSIRNKYNDLLTAKDKLELAQQWEQISKNKLDNAQFKFEKGLISKEDVLNVEEKYLDAQYQTYLAIYNYNITKSEFDTSYVNIDYADEVAEKQLINEKTETETETEGSDKEAEKE